MKTKLLQFLRTRCILLILLPGISVAQVPTCGTNVPFYQVNLVGHPDSTWYSPNHSRIGNCCGTLPPDNCTSFEVLLDTGTAMINFNIASGAIPSGAMFYQIGCGPQIPVGQPICISGPGPHHVTFCKPGNNQNTYMIQAIAKPTMPKPQHVRIGCSQHIKVLGFDTTQSLTWTSIYPGTAGQYNSYLSCTSGCTNPVYTPASNAPTYVIYRVCGTPIATACGYVAVCDTFRVYNEPIITANISPNPAVFCASGSGVTLTVTPSGGYGAYSCTWRDPQNAIVGTGASCQATSAGVYSVEVRDELYNAASCPAATFTVAVLITNPPVVFAGIDQLLCADHPTAYLNGTVLFASGGVWSGGSGTFGPNNTTLNASYTATAAEVAAGSVTLTLTSTGAGAGCSNTSDQVVIHFAPSLTVNLPNVTLACHNSSTILAPYTIGGVGTYSYSWSDGSTGATAQVGEGTICVTITDSLGCNVSTCATVVGPEPLTVTAHTVDCPVAGSGVATVTVSVSGGWQNSYQVSFDNGATYQASGNYTASLPVNATYTVLVKDSNGCTSPNPYVFSVGSQVMVAGVNFSQCYYGVVAATQVTVTPGGGSGGSYWYSFDGGATYQNSGSNVFTLPIDSSYNIMIKDSGGCASAAVAITLPDVLASTATVSAYGSYNISCNGLSDGSIHINTTGGTGPYTYSWNTGSTAQDQNGIAAGSYSVVVTDANNCQDTLSFLLNEPLILSGSLNASTTYSGYNVSCSGSTDAGIDLGVTGGVPAYSYQWSNGATTEDISGIGAGTYSVTITDANNCKDTASITLTEPAVITATISAGSNYNGYNISCHGMSDGSVNLQVSGGAPAYTYSWSNGGTTQNISGVGAGTYQVIVADQNNCRDTLSITINEPPTLLALVLSTSHYGGYNVSCAGSTDGAITLNVIGGVPAYTYNWSNGATSQNQTGIGAGLYSVVVTDANLCSDTLSVLLSEPQALSATVSVTTNYNGYNVSCHGASDAAITANVTGGVTAYGYQWSNGMTTQGMSGIAAGTYSVLVTDANGCADTAGIVVTEPSVLIGAVTSLSDHNGYNISCAGMQDGNININVSGGVASYSYNWSNGSSSQNQANIGAGHYTVIVTDANNCTDTLNIVLVEPQPITAIGNIATDFNGYAVSCFGSTDGAINVTCGGGVPVYTYNWSNGATTQNVSGVGAGTYNVTITDQNACTYSLSFVLDQPQSITATASIQDVLCNSFHNGGIDQSMNGGIAPYSFSWSTGATSEDLNNIGAGSYSVTVTDANNCTYSAAYTISETSPIQISLRQTDVSCAGMANGAIISAVTGGMPGYTYSWSTGANTSQIFGLAGGTYVLIVSDNYHCTSTQTITINEPAVLGGTLNSPVHSDGYNVSTYGGSDGSINTTFSGGTSPYTYAWSNGDTTAELNNIPAGTYTVIVTDKKGCVFSDVIMLTQPFELAMPSGVSPNGDGLNDFFVVKGLDAYPQNHIVIFNRWGNSVFEKDNYTNNWTGKNNSGGDLPDGTYFVIVRIKNSPITLTGYVDLRR